MPDLSRPGPTTQALRLSLGVLGGALLAFALVELDLFAEDDVAPLWVLSLFLVEALVWCATGLLAWARRPSNRTGALLVAGGCTFLVSGLGNTSSHALAVAGTLVASLPLAVAVHVLLAFPSGRVPGRPDRLTVALAYVVAELGPLLGNLSTPGSPIAVTDLPALARAGSLVAHLGGTLVSVSVAVLLLQRLRAAAPGPRRTLGPLYAYGVGSTLAITFAAQLQVLLGTSDLTRFVLQLAALAVIPVAFTAVLLRGGFARTGAVEELSTLLTDDGAPTRDVLARVLGDPTLELLHWLPSERTWVDDAGRPRTVTPQEGRGLVEVTVADRRTGALTYDASLLPDPDLVLAAARPAGLALEAQRLAVELRRSRARLVAAADAERRRVARDLHDGLQVRLVLLALEAGTLAAGTDDTDLAQALQRLRHDTDEAAAELRRTVQSLLPAGLVERGLAAAVEDLVDRLPLPTRLDLGSVPGDLPQDVATTAWYVVAESVTNALKHASATRLEVRLDSDDRHVVVEVRDDGSGGASLDDGSGLRGLVDRVDVLAGQLLVDSGAGAGTRVTALIPVGA